LGRRPLRLGAVKMFSDGSLIGQTAAMRDGYVGDPDNHGMFATPRETLRDWILRSHRSGWQCAVHAIGDLAVEFILDCYEEALRDSPRADAPPPHRALRPRVADATLDRIARLGVIPVPQQRLHRRAGRRVHARARPRARAVVLPATQLPGSRHPLPGSSDRYVVQGAPLLGIHDAVNQRTDGGAARRARGGHHGRAGAPRVHAERAYASFDEDRKGSITPGKLADLVVLGQDPTSIDPAASATWRSSRRWSAGRSCTGRCERRPNRRTQGRRSMTMPSSTSMSATSSVSPVG
jgi:predicted amidohydrolase YtcJ